MAGTTLDKQGATKKIYAMNCPVLRGGSAT
jgi:hypothetical protein